MEKILNHILNELKEIKSDIQDIKALKPKIEESHEWLSALHHNSLVHKAEVTR